MENEIIVWKIWQQILQAVNTIHEERIVHSDLKPANFLLVKGSLKLIDFGIAKAIMSDTTNIQRDSQVILTYALQLGYISHLGCAPLWKLIRWCCNI